MAVLLLAVGCGAQAEDRKTTIVFWYGATQDEQVAYRRMIADFERANPDIRVNAMLVPQGYIERKLILSIAGGVPPDVVRFYAHLGGELMSRGALEPLDKLIERDNFRLQDFYKVGLQQNTYLGKLYGIPWVLSPNALFYNKRMFREAGLDPNRPPRTWAELEHYAAKLTRRDSAGRLQQVGFADFLYNPNNFALYLWQSGGELLAADARSARFDSAEGREALGWMKRFLEQETGGVRELQTFAANFKGATQDPFGLGRIAMRIDSPFRMPDLAKYFPDLEYGVAAIPYNRQPAIEVIGNSLVIPRGSKNREAAWKFVKFASSPKQLAAICGVAGRIPARESVATSPAFYGDPLRRAFIDQLPHGRSVPVAPGWQEVGAELARNIEQVLKGRTTVDAGLRRASASTTRILATANEDMSGFARIPWTVLAIAGGVLLLGAVGAVAAYVRRATAHSASDRREALQFYLFASPWLIGFIVFTFGATAASLVLSFSKWDALSAAHFVGLRNYVQLFTTDGLFYKSLTVTFYYAVFSIPLAIAGGLAVSLLMNTQVLGIRLFRTVYYLPVVISGVATAVLWQFIFNPTTGLLNRLLTMNVMPALSGGRLEVVPVWSTPPGWLLDPAWAMPAFIIMGLWSVGGSMVIYLAALQGVPEQLYEAAKLDGAGSWKSFLHVTLPMLTPAIFYQLVVGTMNSLQMFTQAYIMTGGGPEDATMFYALYLFKNGFEWMKMGYASAMAWILFVVVLLITLMHFRAASRWVYYEGQKEASS